MSDPNITGMIADVQRCSVHDGPGIRTTVFLKGCQLDCAWCHNPETISFEPEYLLYPDKCISCGHCDEGCFSGARVLCGKPRTVESVLGEVMLDEPYYGDDGGVTVSGGEPLCQPAFTGALLAARRPAGIHTAMETNLCVSWDTAWPVLMYCDLVMADLKLWDPKAHHDWTGAGNALVKENLWRLSDTGIPLILRTPVIPGVSDSEEEIGAIARFTAGLTNLRYYELLPYHPLGLSKSQGKEPRRQFDKPTVPAVRNLARRALREGIPVMIGGRPVQDGEGEEP